MYKSQLKYNSFLISHLLIVVMMLVFSGCKLNSEIKVSFESLFQQKSIEILLSSSVSGRSNIATWDIQLTSSEELVDLTAADFTIVNGSIGPIVKVDEKTWTVTVIPSADGVVEIFLLKDVVEGRSTLQKNQASNQISYISDRTPPNVMISYIGTNPTNISPLFVSIVFDEETQTPPSLSHLQITNGVASNLIGSGRNYSLEVTPSSQTATISIQYNANQVIDLVGNNNTVSNILSIDFNSNRPLPTLSSASPSIVNTSAVTVDVHFSDVVTGLDLSDFLLVNGTASNLTGSGDTYAFTLTALSPGNFTAQVKDSAAVDGAINPSLSSAVLSFLYDTVGPTFTLSSSVTSPTDQTSISIDVTANESVTGLTMSDFIITNATASSLTGSGASYTLVVTVNGEGPISVQIPAAVAVDLANNSNSSSNTLNWYHDLLAPTVTITSVQSPITNTSPIVFQFEVSESVVGFISSDIQVTNGTLANFVSVDATHWSVEVTPISEGDVTVVIPAGSFQDQSGRNNTADSLTINFDSVRPTATLAGLTSYTNTSPKSVSLTFSETVTGFDLSDVTLTNATATLSGSGATYTLSVTPSGQGVFSILIPEHSASDGAGNTSLASNLLSSVYDTVAPTVAIAADAGYYNFDSPISLTATFSEDVTGLTSADFTLVGGTLSVVGSGRLYTLSFTPSGTGVKSVTLKANAVLDLAGNSNTVVSSTESFYYDNSPVTISVNQMEQTASENDSTLKSFSILMSAAKTYAVDVYYRLQGTAVSGVDHDLSTTGSIQIPAGATSASIPFNLITNASSNLNKYFQMNLYYANTPAASFGTKYQSRMLIKDVNVARSTPSQISMANMNRCLILSTGALRCWGKNAYGQIGDGTTTNRDDAVDIDAGVFYSQIAVGSNHTCGITTGGDLRCWGLNSKSQVGDGLTANRLSPVTVGTGFTSVGVGSNFSCGIKSGDIYCWGENTIGQLGLGVTGGSRTTPTLVLNGTDDFADISVGSLHACAVDTNKDLYCWGSNGSGQVGDGTIVNKLSPVLIATGYVKVRTHSHAYTGNNTCGLKDTGLIFCWGKNGSGEVGDGTTTDRSVPTATFGGYIYSDLAVGSMHACGLLDSDGKIRCWGANTYNWNPLGGIGHGGLAASSNSFSQPQLVADSEAYTQIAAGFNASCGVTTTNRVKCWGELEVGYLGDPAKNIRVVPEISDLGESYSQVGSGASNGCGITTTGILKCWSGDYYTPYQTGDGTTVLRTSTVVIDRARAYSSVSVGYQHRCGIRSTGNLYCWGSGANGRLGTSATSDRALPTKIDGSSLYLQVSTGGTHTCGITNQQVLKCWGSDTYGQVGDGLSSDVLSPKIVNSGTSYSKVAAGANSTCAITTAGDLQCWGYNYYGTVGIGTNVNSYRTPQSVMAGTKFIDVSAGSNFVCAISDAKDLYCWGEGGYYRLGLGNASDANTPQLVASGTKFDLVRAGSTSACGIRTTDKLVMCWGTNNPYGVLTGVLGNNNVSANVPGLISDTDTYIDLSPSTSSVCGVTSTNVLKCWGHNRFGGIANDSIFRMWGAPVDVTDWLIP